MISIVLSSYKPQQFHACVNSIEQTIGVPYEIIKVDNPGVMTIAEAYNQGMQRAQYEILCFVHEDILFKDQQWGLRVASILEDKSIGVIGIAGSKVMGKAPGAWWEFGTGHYVQNLIQHARGAIVHNRTFGIDYSSNPSEVAVIDGVFIAFRKSTGLQFNAAIPGFHAYDLGISMEAHLKGLKVVVADGILLEHFSSGTIDQGWFMAMDKFYDHYHTHLPVIGVGNTKDLTQYEDEAFKYFILNVSSREIQMKYWKRLLKRNLFSKFHLAFLRKMIFG